MAGRHGAKQIAPMIRGAFIRAVKGMEDGGKPLSTLIRQSLEERPLETLKAISSFIPKELMIEADITHQVSELSDEALQNEIGRLLRTTEALSVIEGEAEKSRH